MKRPYLRDISGWPEAAIAYVVELQDRLVAVNDLLISAQQTLIEAGLPLPTPNQDKPNG